MSVTKNHLIEVMRQMLDSDREDAGLPPVGGAGVPYQSYVAKLDFDGAAVTATVLHNDLEENLVWTGISNRYQALLPVWVLPGQVALFNSALGHDDDDQLVFTRLSVAAHEAPFQVRIVSFNLSESSVYLMGYMYVEIRIYPPTA